MYFQIGPGLVLFLMVKIVFSICAESCLVCKNADMYFQIGRNLVFNCQNLYFQIGRSPVLFARVNKCIFKLGGVLFRFLRVLLLLLLLLLLMLLLLTTAAADC